MINNKENSDREGFDKRLTVELIRKAKGGNAEAFFELKKQYTPLLESLIYKHTLPEMLRQESDDMQQEALIAFCNAVCSYDCDFEGVEFGLYAKICIENCLASYKRSYIRRHQNISLPIESAEELTDLTVTDPLQLLVEKEKTDELVRSIKNVISEYENRVWWMYVSGMSPSEIAKVIGKSDAKSVSNAIYRIRKKLRAVIGNQH